MKKLVCLLLLIKFFPAMATEDVQTLKIKSRTVPSLHEIFSRCVSSVDLKLNGNQSKEKFNDCLKTEYDLPKALTNLEFDHPCLKKIVDQWTVGSLSGRRLSRYELLGPSVQNCMNLVKIPKGNFTIDQKIGATLAMTLRRQLMSQPAQEIPELKPELTRMGSVDSH